MKKENHLTRKHASQRRKNFLLRVFLIIVTIFMLYPLVWNIYSSFKTSTEFLGNPFALPSSLQWDNYVRAFRESNIGNNFINSAYIVILSLILLVLLVIPCSYCLSRFRFWGGRFMKNFYMSMIFIQAPCIMIPLFMQMSALNWLNKLTPLSLLYAVLQGPFSIFLLSGFMQGIPKDYEEAAMIDGCGYWRILRSVIVPLAKPGVVTVIMLAAMNIWNEYVVALVMLTDPKKQTVPVGVAAMYEVQRYATDWGALFAALVMVLLPTAVVYAIGQKYLMEGVSAGGVKG